MDPTEPLRDEGPFGDHTGYYTLPEPYPVFHVTAITHRKDAVYPATIVGIPPMEDFYIGGAALTRPGGHPLPSDGRGAGGEGSNFPRSWTSRCRPKASSTTSSGVGERTRLAETFGWPERSVRRDAGHGRRDARAPLQNHARPLGHGADDPATAGPNTSSWWTTTWTCTTPAKSSSASAPAQRQHRPATRQPLHQRPVRRARPRHQSRACGTSGSKLGIDATKKIPGEGFKRPWPPLIKMDESVKAKVEKLFG